MRCFSALALLLLSAPLWAADVAGSRDLEVLLRFPGSQIVDFKESAEQERIYPQGAIRRISGKLRYEREDADLAEREYGDHGDREAQRGGQPGRCRRGDE
jgi:hypothetical protein